MPSGWKIQIWTWVSCGTFKVIHRLCFDQFHRGTIFSRYVLSIATGANIHLTECAVCCALFYLFLGFWPQQKCLLVLLYCEESRCLYVWMNNCTDIDDSGDFFAIPVLGSWNFSINSNRFFIYLFIFLNAKTVPWCYFFLFDCLWCVFQLCSACRRPGATLGCFFKSCPNKYHYRCALELGECHPLSSHFPHSTQEQSALTYPPACRQEPLQLVHSFLTYMDYADSSSEVICVGMESWTEWPKVLIRFYWQKCADNPSKRTK